MIEKNTNRDAIPYNILMADNFVGLKVRVDDISDYSYLLFEGKKVAGNGQPSVLIYNDKNEVLAECCVDCKNTDLQRHQYLVNVKELEGTVTILFNGGSIKYFHKRCRFSISFSVIWNYIKIALLPHCKLTMLYCLYNRKLFSFQKRQIKTKRF